MCYVPQPYLCDTRITYPPGYAAGVSSALREDTYLAQTTDESITTSSRPDTIRLWFERELYSQGNTHLA